MFKRIKVKTSNQVELIDITSKIKNIVKESRVKSGILVINVPHTTAAVTINENADPDVNSDIINEINKIVPFNDNYKHMEGNSAAHIKSSIIGSSENIIIDNGQLILGRWQGIFFCELDGPRNRKMNIKIIKG
ncbi:MAG: secondary thiamine-phosphate synthase enzyme YjbQ [Bacillota bacterium]